jgi:ribosomal protein S18 acetylase RimI-like enzyme
MTIIVEEIKKLDTFIDFFIEYLETAHNVTDKDQIDQIISNLKQKFDEGKRIIFLSYQNKKPIGFISGKNEGEIFETSGFYIREKDNIDDCGFKLITSLVSKAFDLGFKFYRQSITLPANFEPSLEDKLKKEGFCIYPRVGMKKELSKDEKLSTDLPERYSFEPFSVERVDELFQLMSDANPPDHTDSHIYPEMLDPAKSKEIFAKFSKDFTLIDGDLNPQIIFDNKLVGLSFILAQNPEMTFVLEVCISPQHQRKGLGKALMNKIIVESANKGFKSIGLAVTVDNTGAYKLYEKLGFKIQSNYLSITKANK